MSRSLTQELWRYSCETCGSVLIRKRRECRGNSMAEFSHFYCKECRVKSPYAYDKKKGESAHIRYF